MTLSRRNSKAFNTEGTEKYKNDEFLIGGSPLTSPRS
jgi:hypothetical protein